LFDQNTGDRITPDQHYKTSDDVVASLFGTLTPLQDVMPGFIMLDGLRSDMMVPTNQAEWFFKEVNNHEPLSQNNPLVDPSSYYKAIININEVLGHIDSVVVSDREFNDLLTFACKGALVSMRSWVYLNLVRLYGETAYFEDNMASLPTSPQVIKEKAWVIDTLINQVKQYIHEESTFSARIEYRVFRFVNSKALLGELYLEKGDYANAAKYLKLGLESYSTEGTFFRADAAYRDLSWVNIFLNSESVASETLSVIPFSVQDGQINKLGTWLGRVSPVAKISPVLLDSFIVQTTTQGTQGDFFRGQGSTFIIDKVNMITDSTYTYEANITKYAVDRNEPSSSDIIISRAADIHLLLAEAYNRLGDADSRIKALMLLNNGVAGLPSAKRPADFKVQKWTGNLGIRGRVSLTDRIAPKSILEDPILGIPEDAVILAIEDMIIAERALELAFEGKRWFDLVRIAERRNDPSFLADKVAAKFAGTPQYETVRTKLLNSENWYLQLQQ
jgi:hypothetical protein